MYAYVCELFAEQAHKEEILRLSALVDSVSLDTIQKVNDRDEKRFSLLFLRLAPDLL